MERGIPIKKGRGEEDVCPETGKGNNTRNVYKKYSSQFKKRKKEKKIGPHYQVLKQSNEFANHLWYLERFIDPLWKMVQT